MNPTPELIKALEEDDRRRETSMTPAQKFRAGGDLFDTGCRWTLAGIRSQHPDFTPEQAMAELKRRVNGARRREERC